MNGKFQPGIFYPVFFFFAGNMNNKSVASMTSISPVAVGINMHSETVNFLKMSSSTVIYCG